MSKLGKVDKNHPFPLQGVLLDTDSSLFWALFLGPWRPPHSSVHPTVKHGKFAWLDSKPPRNNLLLDQASLKPR